VNYSAKSELKLDTQFKILNSQFDSPGSGRKLPHQRPKIRFFAVFSLLDRETASIIEHSGHDSSEAVTS
jgi:hypothetical protein